MIEILLLAFNQTHQGIFKFSFLIGLFFGELPRFKVLGKKIPRYLTGHQIEREPDIRATQAVKGKVNPGII
jgi:hypothetical protein